LLHRGRFGLKFCDEYRNERSATRSTSKPGDEAQFLFFCFLVGFPLRLVFAILRSSFLLIDLYIPREAPLSDDTDR
jgi:hypothetical protein